MIGWDSCLKLQTKDPLHARHLERMSLTASHRLISYPVKSRDWFAAFLFCTRISALLDPPFYPTELGVAIWDGKNVWVVQGERPAMTSTSCPRSYFHLHLLYYRGQIIRLVQAHRITSERHIGVFYRSSSPPLTSKFLRCHGRVDTEGCVPVRHASTAGETSR